ncbi:MAG: hypothetical protein KDJ99_09650, partial [Candidatus Competibacteraceae bacterium]|nr:hypothetical protein [Candidatus Competibacteraceae bacterium]
MTNHLKLVPQRDLVTLALLVTVLIALANPALGADFNASDETTLNAAITGVNSAGAGTHTINITADINLSDSTTALDNTAATEIIINGNGFTVDGQGINGVRPFEIGVDTTVAINDLTISGGKVKVPPGDYGGGIRNLYGSLRLVNSTVSGNSAGANGGGIHNEGAVTLTHSIIAGQTSGVDCSGIGITSNGYNLDSDGSCGLSGTGDIANGTADLQPLAVNAPGTTATHALGPDSGALDVIPVVNGSC